MASSKSKVIIIIIIIIIINHCSFLSSFRYSLLVPAASTTPPKPFMHSFMSKEEHSEVADLFLKAAQLSPESLDPDVQVSLIGRCL